MFGAALRYRLSFNPGLGRRPNSCHITQLMALQLQGAKPDDRLTN
jgi:hypothetical protein